MSANALTFAPVKQRYGTSGLHVSEIPTTDQVEGKRCAVTQGAVARFPVTPFYVPNVRVADDSPGARTTLPTTPFRDRDSLLRASNLAH